MAAISSSNRAEPSAARPLPARRGWSQARLRVGRSAPHRPLRHDEPIVSFWRPWETALLEAGVTSPCHVGHRSTYPSINRVYYDSPPGARVRACRKQGSR